MINPWWNPAFILKFCSFGDLDSIQFHWFEVNKAQRETLIPDKKKNKLNQCQSWLIQNGAFQPGRGCRMQICVRTDPQIVNNSISAIQWLGLSKTQIFSAVGMGLPILLHSENCVTFKDCNWPARGLTSGAHLDVWSPEESMTTGTTSTPGWNLTTGRDHWETRRFRSSTRCLHLQISRLPCQFLWLDGKRSTSKKLQYLLKTEDWPQFMAMHFNQKQLSWGLTNINIH